jgi:hypothetical protein
VPPRQAFQIFNFDSLFSLAMCGRMLFQDAWLHQYTAFPGCDVWWARYTVCVPTSSILHLKLVYQGITRCKS